MQIRMSTEDYLETILLLSRKSGVVRSIDIVNDMGFSKPSVSVAMKKLRESGLIVVGIDGHITLTDKGELAARQVYERHTVLYDWLVAIGVSESVAAADACKMEHVLSDETFFAIKRLLRLDCNPAVTALPLPPAPRTEPEKIPPPQSEI